MANKKTEEKIQIKLVKSLIGTKPNQRAVARALGFTKKDQVVEHAASATILGMVNKISHLVEVVK
ncbi:50S ribosomal protein L30 [bacterium]|nr:50S ribosomal protein L30 [bacterium]